MGFDPEWLAMREGYDHLSRGESLGLIPAIPGARVVDLACGTGSNLRFLSPRMPGRQHWTLVDHDARLLDAARERLGLPTGQHDGEAVDWGAHRVGTLQADLRAGFPALDCDLVVTTALLDLVDAGFVDALVAWLAGRPLLASLTVDGRIEWTPSDPRDSAVHAAFRAHQLLDRGFGPSLGVGASEYLRDRLVEAGYQVEMLPTTWQIPASDGPMLAEMARGIAQAAGECGAEVDGWLADKLAAIARGEVALAVGHWDVLGR
ncbi:MAG: methyltransferase domain-containing protein [Myxococcota bacterium]|nr:methyltransferase domain-containing protein [Myxococcota bacterium]